MGKVKVVPMSLVTALLLCCYLHSVTATCGGLQGDVIFLLDSSGSVGYYDFRTMLQFVEDLVDDFDIGSDNVRVGVAKYETSVTTEINLNDFYDKTSLKRAISLITYTGGLTYTGDAIAHMTSTMFTAANGDRSNIPDVGIVITDGLSTVEARTTYQAFLARSQGITMFAIGVGTGVTELNSIATDPDSDHVFTVTSFSGLTNIESSFQTKACTSTVFQSAPTVTITDDNTATVVGAVVGSLVGVGAVVVVVVIILKFGKTALVKVVPSAFGANPSNGPQRISGNPQPVTQPPAYEPPIPGMIVSAQMSMAPVPTRYPGGTA